MSVVVFSGPSLSPVQAQEAFPEAECLGPAAQGSFLEALARGPQAICLVDGVFEGEPAVTHKEILWALSKGVAVFGAASMGALRAVELAPFGMVGRGTVFGEFMEGRLEDEDEVAVAHASAEHGYRAGSDAMVSVRATLTRARDAKVAVDADIDHLIEEAKRTFYAERDLWQIVRRVGASADLGALKSWLKQSANWVDVKRADALELLAYVRGLLLEGNLAPPDVDWAFPHTAAWEEVLTEYRTAGPRASGAPPQAREDATAFTWADLADVVEELQLLGPEVFADVMLSASWRAVALALSQRGEPEGSGVAEAGASIVGIDATIETFARQTQVAISRQVPHVLRLQGDLHKVLERARAKRAVVASSQRATHEPGLIAWYFRERLRQPMPEDVDAYARGLGLASASALESAISRERLFLKKLPY